MLDVCKFVFVNIVTLAIQCYNTSYVSRVDLYMSRDRAEVARQPHKLECEGSSPSPATKN